jgi:hypothetical protein
MKYLATLTVIDTTTLEQGNGSLLASKPGSSLASAEGFAYTRENGTGLFFQSGISG